MPISTALCLPASDIELLIQGATIVALPCQFVHFGNTFALYPVPSVETVSIEAWASCEKCKTLEPEKLGDLSRASPWSMEVLQEKLQTQGNLFLAHLRVYRLVEPVQLPLDSSSYDKIGKFIGVPGFGATDPLPVLNNQVFARRRYGLEQLLPPQHTGLEKLLPGIAELPVTPTVQALERDIRVLLGWSTLSFQPQPDPDLEWISDIVALGNRSKEEDKGKSNYQAGTDFENIVRRALEFLGFTIDEAYKGGAGGLDLFCSKPYPLVGECKAGKKIPSGTTEELLKLGGMHLGTEQFLGSAKLIIGPGNPTKDVLRAAEKWKVSIINPMSLQKLVELQAKYPGSINLVELREYLDRGQIDYRIEEYIEKIEEDVRLRSHVIQLVKNYLESQIALQSGQSSIDINTLFGLYCGSNPPQSLQLKELRDILIELSSPLAGYLGRGEDNQGNDCFYFLRDLVVTTCLDP